MNMSHQIIPIHKRAVFDENAYREYLASAGSNGIEIKNIENPVSEEELLRKECINPDDIKRLKTYTHNYLCPRTANVYGIRFIRYAVRNFETGKIIFDLRAQEDASRNEQWLQPDKTSTEKSQCLAETKYSANNENQHIKFNQDCQNDLTHNLNDYNNKLDIIESNGKGDFKSNVNTAVNNSGDSPEETCLTVGDLMTELDITKTNILNTDVFEIEDTVERQDNEIIHFDIDYINGPVLISDRRVNYRLPTALLFMSTIGAMVEFSIGNNEIKNFRMIELHFFKDKLIKTFDFNFGFCIPNSVNSWEHIYQIPKFPNRMVKEMINSPYETRSETFYFANGKLVIHNKAEYAYNESNELIWD